MKKEKIKIDYEKVQELVDLYIAEKISFTEYMEKLDQLSFLNGR